MANETIAPVVEFTATDGTKYQLCWSFREIRKAEAQVPGAQILQGLLGSGWNCTDAIAAFLGSARKLQPELTPAQVEELVTSDKVLLEMVGATMNAWQKSRENPSNPAKDPVPAGDAKP